MPRKLLYPIDRKLNNIGSDKNLSKEEKKEKMQDEVFLDLATFLQRRENQSKAVLGYIKTEQQIAADELDDEDRINNPKFIFNPDNIKITKKNNAPKYYCVKCKTRGGTQTFPITNSLLGMVNSHIFSGRPTIPLCNKCLRDLYKILLERHNGNHIESMFHLCFLFDVYFDKVLISSIIDQGFSNSLPHSYIEYICNGNESNPWRYMNFFNTVMYKDGKLQIPETRSYQDFVTCREQGLLENFSIPVPKDAYDKIPDIVDMRDQYEKLTRGKVLQEEDLINQRLIMKTYHYDPFEEEQDVGKRIKLYRNLAMMIDDSFNDDLLKQKSALRICNIYEEIDENQKRIEEFTAKDDDSKESVEILAKLKKIQKENQDTINAIADKNGLSSKNKIESRGSGTLTYQMKQMEQKGYDSAITNLYDIKTSQCIQKCSDISVSSIMKQLNLGEQEYSSMVAEQAKEIRKLTAENEKLQESLRLALVKIKKQEMIEELKKEYKDKGLSENAIEEVIKLELNIDEDDK